MFFVVNLHAKSCTVFSAIGSSELRDKKILALIKESKDGGRRAFSVFHSTNYEL